MAAGHGNTALQIPVVDFSGWRGGNDTERRKIAEQLVAACKEVGFAYIVNHAVSPDRLDQAFEWSAKFFGLSQEQKLQAPHPDGPAVHRGYSWPGLEKVSNATSEEEDRELAEQLRQVPDCKESYDMGSDHNEEQPNVWIPDRTLPGFRGFMTEFYGECSQVAGDLLRAIALGIGLDDEDYLIRLHSGVNNQLRLLHYPPVPAESLENGLVTRMPAHSDWSSITMLFQDDCGGLEVEDPKAPGHFIEAKPMKDAAVFNVGDLLMRWSNDQLRSTSHRVSPPPLPDRYLGPSRMTRERYSIPYFVSPESPTVVSCLPACMSKNNPPKYEPITRGDYNRMRAMTQYEAKGEQAY